MIIKNNLVLHVIALIFFMVLSAVFFKPGVFDGKRLIQGDISQGIGGNKELVDYKNSTGEYALWTNSMFGGMPAYFLGIPKGNAILGKVHLGMGLGVVYPFNIFTIAMLSFYILLLVFGVRPPLAILGAVSFAFSSYNVIGLVAGHNARLNAIIFIPLVIAGVHLCMTRNKWLGAGMTALALSVHLRVNHLQITYYLLLMLIIYGLIYLFNALKKGEAGTFFSKMALLVLAACLAVATFFGQFYTTLEFNKFSNRSQSELTDTNDTKQGTGLDKDYAFQYSNGLLDPMTLLIPNMLGNSEPLPENSSWADVLKRNGYTDYQIRSELKKTSGISYWGKESPTIYYAGAIMIFLFIVGVILVDRKIALWLASIVLIGIILSYGRNLSSINYFLFDHLPGYNKFRSPTFIIMFSIFGISLLGTLGLEELLKNNINSKKLKKTLLIAFLCSAGISILMYLFAGVFDYSGKIDAQLPNVLVDALKNDRKSLLRGDALRSFILISLFACLVFFRLKNKISKNLALFLMISLVSFDILGVASRFIDEDNYGRSSRSNSTFPTTAADNFIIQNKQLGDRVLSVHKAFFDASTSFHHHSIGGYHAVRLGRYEDIINNNLLSAASRIRNSIQKGNLDMRDFPVLNMLNTKYIMSNSEVNGVHINQHAYGATWFIANVEQAQSPKEEFNKTSINANKEIAIVDESKFKVSQNRFSTDGTISLVDYHPGYWKYESENSGKSLVAFSEIYYPKDLSVKIDGRPTQKMIRLNYLLRGLEVDPGKHIIEVSFY